MTTQRIFLEGEPVRVEVSAALKRQPAPKLQGGDQRAFLRAVDECARPGCLTVVRVDELTQVVEKYGRRAGQDLLDELVHEWRGLLPSDAVFHQEPDGEVLVLLQQDRELDLPQALTRVVAGEPVRISIVTGRTELLAGTPATELLRNARHAADAAHTKRDLRAETWSPELPAVTRTGPHQHPVWQVVLTWVAAFLPPLVGYAVIDLLGLNITPVAYYVVLTALLATSLVIWIEGFRALDPVRPPTTAPPEPKASAVIAAYLPNEAAHVLSTVHALLDQDWAGELQVVLAYNTPHRLPVERELRALAASDPRFVPLYVHNSTSKAQNINAALQVVDGEFVGLYDADHLASPDSFTRAWRWLGNGWDVVQGHCAVRNGGVNWVSQMIAVEFEGIYAVSHPGRAQVHDFGIFGGSNGFWRTDLLHTIRFQPAMLTEDIDATMRALLGGAKIANDPALVSRELAPTTLRSLWNQRMRWAQGWHQVSRRHLWAAMHSDQLSLQQKAGMGFLLGWREIYPWLSMQMLPVLVYEVLIGQHLKWALPVFLMTSALTIGTGPFQVLFAYRLAEPEIRRHRLWFLRFLVVAPFYAEMRNTISRVAQLRELLGTHAWVVTTRGEATVEVAVDDGDLPTPLPAWKGLAA